MVLKEIESTMSALSNLFFHHIFSFCSFSREESALDTHNEHLPAKS